MLLVLQTSLMTGSKDFENKSASSDQASHIWISVFHSDAKTFGEVTFHLEVKSFIPKFLDWFVDASSFGAAVPASSAHKTMSTPGQRNRHLLKGHSQNPCFNSTLRGCRHQVLGANFDLWSDRVAFKHPSLPHLFMNPLGAHMNIGLSDSA